MRPGGWVALIVLALHAAGAAGQGAVSGWTQLGGDMGHSGAAELSDRPLDVVHTFRLTGAPQEFLAGGGTALVSTPYGPVGMVRVAIAPTFVCQLFRITDVAAGRVERFGATVACAAGARVLAYDAANDAIVLEFDGVATDPMLQSWDAATGELRWGTGPEIPVAEPPGAFDDYDWYLNGFAMDEGAGEVYVAFTQEGTGRHRLEAIALADGARRWSTTVPATLFAEVSAPSAASEEASAHFVAAALTATTDGLLVSGEILDTLLPTAGGRLPGSPSGASYMALAWLDRNGTAVGAATARTDPGEPPETSRFPGHSSWAASLGSRGAYLLDGRLLLVDPVNAKPQVVEIGPSEIVTGSRAAPAWSREALVVPLATTAIIYPVGDPSNARLWPGFEGSTITSVLVAPPADAYALVSRLTKDGTVADLVRIDIGSARTVDRLPLPFSSSARFHPLGDGRMLVYNIAGEAALLAPAPEALRPRISLDNAYPAAGEEFSLVATVSGQVRGMTVAWGDGVLDRAEPGSRIVHAYEAPGRRIVRVSALYPDNRTGTAEAIVYVGDNPPRELNFMQQAFSPERQELTFFMLGLAATAAGGAIALGRRFRRRSRLQTDLEELDRIRELARNDAFDAVRRLAEHRQRMKQDLASGALDDAQYTALSHEAVRLLAALRARLLGGLEGQVSRRFVNLFETAIEDGQVTASEAETLLDAMRGEGRLAGADRERLVALVAALRADGAS